MLRTMDSVNLQNNCISFTTKLVDRTSPQKLYNGGSRAICMDVFQYR
jgi:hypothetical protein